MKTTRKTSTIKTKGPEITALILKNLKPISRIAEKINDVSEKSIQRMAKGEKVGEELVDSLAKYFKVNVNEIAETENFLYLDRIQSWPELYANENYQFSRKNSNHSNHLSHKLYKVDDFSESMLLDIQHFLKNLYANQNEESSDRGTSDDIEKEIQYLRKINTANLCFKRLVAQGIGVYYGHYNHRHIQRWKTVKDPDSVTMSGLQVSDYEPYNFYVPNGFRVEVIYFYKTNDYKKNENFTIPNKIKIFPEVGYSKKELYDFYMSAIKDRGEESLKRIKEKKIPDNEKGTLKNLVTDGIAFYIDNYFKKHENNLWLSVPDNSIEGSLTSSEMVDQGYGFRFINDYQKDISDFLNGIEHLILDSKLEKYNGPVEESNDMTPWSNFLEESKETVSNEDFDKLDSLRRKMHEQAIRLKEMERRNSRDREIAFRKMILERRKSEAELLIDRKKFEARKKVLQEESNRKDKIHLDRFKESLKKRRAQELIKNKKKEDAMK